MLTIPNEVTSLLKTDGTWKNFRVHFPNGERSDITNDNVVSESVSFTESICSEQSLKLGLCETPYIEFETFGVENIKGDTIECSMEVDCEDYCEDVEYLEMPYYHGTSRTHNNVVYTVDQDTGYVSTSGIASGTAQFFMRFRDETLSAGDYLVTGCPQGGSRTTYYQWVALYDSNANYSAVYDIGEGVILTVPQAYESYTLMFGCYIGPGQDSDGLVFKPSIKKIDSCSYTNVLEYPYYYTTRYSNGITYTDNGDGSITVSGTADANSNFMFRYYNEGAIWQKGYYRLKGCPSGGSTTTYRLIASEGKASAPTVETSSANDFGEGNYIELEDNSVLAFYIWIANGQYVNFTMTPTFELVSDIELEQTCPITDSYYASDIGKWVYSIPYGKFVVDSCKKQADMTHRRVIAYGEGLTLNTDSPTQLMAYSNSVPLFTRSYTDVGIRACEITDSDLFGDITLNQAVLTDMTLQLYPLETGYDYKVNLKAKILDVINDVTTYTLYKLVTGDYLETLADIKTAFETYGWMDFIEPYYYPSNNLYQYAVESGEESYTLLNSISNKKRTYIELLRLYASLSIDGQYLIIPYEINFYSANESINDTYTLLDETAIEAYQCISPKFAMWHYANESAGTYYYIPHFTSSELNEMLGGIYEIDGFIGRMSRYGQISGISPANLFASPVESLTPTDYETLWYDDYASKPYGRVICYYTNLNNETALASYDIVANFNINDYRIYDVSDNYWIKHNTYSATQMSNWLQTIGTNLSGVTYMPTNLTMLGRPDLEAGDVITVTTLDGDVVTTWLMQRNLDGIMALFDDITAQSEE